MTRQPFFPPVANIDGAEAVEIMEEAGLSRAAGLLPEGVGTEPAVATAA
jgi:hypothetical protein